MRCSRLRIAFLLICTAMASHLGCSQPNATGDRAAEEAPATAESREPTIEVADATNAEAPALDVPTEPEHRPTAQSAPPPAPLPASEAPLPQDRIPTAELSMPKVVLSEQHASMSKIKVGDQFPNLELPDVAGQQRSLTELYGGRLTLVVFWSSLQPTALEELSDMNRYFLPRFADKGLAVVAVNSRESATQAGELAKAAGATYPILSDADGKGFEQVASDKLPRSYLLDASGRVIWFDLEYSPTTRRDLAVALRHTLGD